MKFPYSIVIFNLGLVLLFSFIFWRVVNNILHDGAFYPPLLGIVSVLGGAADVLIAIVFFIGGKKNVGKGFLLSAVVLIAIGCIGIYVIK
jgi:hypothetical protein